jgi:hypothetical protein
MKYEITYLDNKLLYSDCESLEDCFKSAPKRWPFPIKLIRILISPQDEVSYWKEVYTRKYSEVIAYVNAFLKGKPVASVPVKIVVESYQSIKEVLGIVDEIDRLKKIWPEAEIKVQKRFTG